MITYQKQLFILLTLDIKDMNREILFKAKLSYCNKWIEGNLIIAENGRPYIIPKEVFIVDGHHLRIDSDNAYWVIPETVCQFTGLLDKNGNKIWEGDILREPPQTEWDKKSYKAFEVFWHDNDCCDRHIGWQFNRLHFHGNLCGGYTFETFKPEYVSKMIIIGNIFDNKELLRN